VTFDGDPGSGKSTITLDLASRLSSGRPMPDGTRSDLRGPTSVIVISAEDAAGDTIRPRCDAAGGNLRRIHLLRDVRVIDKEGRSIIEPWSTPTYAGHLRQAILHFGAQLVVIDPLSAFVSARLNVLNEQDLRRALYPLSQIAEETGCAILIVRHFTKSGGSNPLYRGGGAISGIGHARAGLIVARDPDDETGTWSELAVAKANLAIEAPSLRYRLVSKPETSCSEVLWGEASRHRASDLLREPLGEDERSNRKQIAEMLLLATENGPILVKAAQWAVRSAGFSEAPRTITRAARSVGISTATTNTFPAQHFYLRAGQELPSVDTGSNLQASVDSVQTGSIRENSDSGLSVDSPRELSTLTNGKATHMTEEGLGDLPALA